MKKVKRIIPNSRVSSVEIEKDIARIIRYIGDDSQRDGLIDTPRRVVKAYAELFSGYKKDPQSLLERTFKSDYDEMVILKDIEFYSFCEHHILPFFGSISIAYIPNGKVLGISKLARLVEVFSRRLQIQEQLTEQIAYAIDEKLHPKGVAVYVKAKHFCMIARGIKKQNSIMITSKLLGNFLAQQQTRQEFFDLIK